MVLASVGAGGRVSLFNFAGEVDVLVDVAGWYDGDSVVTASGGCVVATPAPAPPPSSPAPLPAPVPPPGFADGTYRVGVDIPAGRYQAPGGSSCYWERLSGFGGTFAEIVANDYASTSPIVSISPSDVGFKSDKCGTWSRLS